MPLFTPAERRFVDALARLAHANPFLPERIDAEREALGREFDEQHADWNLHWGPELAHPNLDRLQQRAAAMLATAHARLQAGRSLAASEEELYDDLILFVVFHRHRLALDRIIAGEAGDRTRRAAAAAYRALATDAERYLTVRGQQRPLAAQLHHAFATFFQIRRAYRNIFEFIVGLSPPAVKLRATVWQSIFSHDMRRYRRLLYPRMGDFTTLVTGPSGTGKELVARAVGLSRYIPFDPRREEFAEHFAGTFYAINLSAFSPTLIESELFGHRRGAYTGAVADRAGWLEECPELGTVFLDEIGEVEPAIQVKLLRVLQTREFSRLGETQPRRFRGKLIAATNRDLAEEIRAGRFREDLYYRLCSDVIEMPTLHQRLAESPDELPLLVGHMAQRLLGPDAAELTAEVLAAIARDLGVHYAWPGNVRELEQCVRNVLVRKSYRPGLPAGLGGPAPETGPVSLLKEGPWSAISRQIEQGELSAEGLLRHYCTLIYARTGSYEAAAARLGLDRRTVRARVDAELCQQLRGSSLAPRTSGSAPPRAQEKNEKS